MGRFRRSTLTGEARSPLAMIMAVLLMVFLVLFPKGGFRLGPLPLTWGYLLLGIATLPALLLRIIVFPLRFQRSVLLAIALLLPFQLLSLYAFKFYGILNPPFAFSTFVGLAALPWMFLLLFQPFYRRLDGELLARCFRGCVFYAAAWGIFLFFLHPVTHHFIEVPYLTVNASDFGELESTKNIGRGFFFKLISTYNNGNLYGVATLLLAPLYARMEPSKIRRFTLSAALFLTLSRAVWVGLIFSECLSLGMQMLRQIPTFPVVYLGTARRRFIAVAAIVGFMFFSLLFISYQGGGIGFLLDATGGNRIDQVYAAQGSGWLPEHGLYGFQEVLYASALQYWGKFGLIAFCMILFSPLLLAVADPQIMRTPLRRAALKGLVLYIFMATADGALDFIPVMAFYWFVYSVLLFGWPGRAPIALPRQELGGSWLPARLLALIPSPLRPRSRPSRLLPAR